MKILCLDIGTKRIGVAISDAFGWTAQGLDTLVRKNDDRVRERLLNMCRENDIKHVIVGMPLDQEGKLGKSAQRIEKFRANLEDYLHEDGVFIPVEGYDERYSTAEAEERLIQADVSRAKRRKIIDKMAAVVILEGYLREYRAK